ncbi:MAG: cysteine hydrolase [Ilumatobacteraceae bacterium]
MRGLDKGEKPGLVMMECQVEMIGEEAAARGHGLAVHAQERHMPDRVAELVAAFRAGGLPVIHCLFLPRKDMLGTAINSPLFGGRWKKRSLEPDGSPDDNPVHPKLAPVREDFVLTRHHGLEAFHDTELDSLLRIQDVDTVVLCGVSTNIGVPGTALGGLNRGYQVVVPEDGTAGAWPEAHEFQITHTLPLLATVTTVADIIDCLAKRDA